MAIPEFRTERLILRGIREEDAPAYETHFVDSEVIRFLTAQVPWPYPENGVLEHLHNKIIPNQGRSRWAWGLFLIENPETLIGLIELYTPGVPENRAFWLGKKYWGVGLMTEAAVPIMDHAFTGLAFDSLVFSNAVGNKRSRRIKEKTGARFLRTELAEFVDPSFTEKEIWELSSTEWEKTKTQLRDRQIR
jgi:RimJ/RimL family protein N-acetyltransferase